jgi:hypothetical protein
MSTPVSALEEAPPRKSFAARFVGVFLAPHEAFADVARAPDFVAPLVVFILSIVAVTETMLAKIGMERIVRQSIERSSRASSLTPEQMQQAVEQGARIGSIFAHAAFVWAVIPLLIYAGIGWAIVNLILGGQVNFKTAFSVTCYAELVSSLGALTTVATILFGDPEHFNPDSPGPGSAGFFLNPLETSKPLMSLASSLDIFLLWFMILLAIGFSEATGRKV